MPARPRRGPVAAELPSDDRRAAARARIRRARLRSYAPALVIAGAFAVAALVAIPLGGWDEVELQSEQLPEVELGEAVDSSRVSTAIRSIELAAEHPDGFSEPEPGMTWMVVHATIGNRLEIPQYAAGSRLFYPFTIEGALSQETSTNDVRSVLERDGSVSAQLNPGIVDDVAIVFPVKRSDFADGDTVEVVFWDATRQEADLYRGIRWWAPHPVAQVPVEIGAAQ